VPILAVLLSVQVLAENTQNTEVSRGESISSLSEKLNTLEAKLEFISKSGEKNNKLIAKNSADNLVVWNRYSIFEDVFVARMNKEAGRSKIINDNLRQENKSLSSEISTIRQVLKVSREKTISTQEASEELAREIRRLEEHSTKNTAVVESMFSSVSDDMTTRTLALASCIVILFMALIWFRHRFSTNNSVLSGEIMKARTALDGEYNELDLKLTELLEKQVETESTLNSSTKDSGCVEVDHSLPLKVATEIHRMRKRIISMPSDTKGIKPLTKALERLEESLADQDYIVVDMQGKKYIEGMTVNHDMVMSEDFSPGEKIITKVVKPQVNFKDNIIQVADVVVSVGE